MEGRRISSHEISLFWVTLFGLVFYFVAPASGEDDACTTPNRVPGTCVQITHCASQLAILQDRQKTKAQIKFLQDSQCGIGPDGPLICCASGGCTTADNTPGACVSIDECPRLRQLFDGPKPLGTQTAQYLSRSACQGPTPFSVCCGSQGGSQPAPTISTTTTGHWDSFTVGSEISEDLDLEDIPETEILVCGRRQINHTALITNEESKKRDWPWHTAIYKSDRKFTSTYICGGSLLTPTRVLTAGHCTVEKDAPIDRSRLLVVVGKFNLFGNDEGSQERTVNEIILHPNYVTDTLKDDIAILVLSTAVLYTQFIQPVCLWQKKLTDRSIIDNQFGHVIGWGYNERKEVSSTLSHAVMPVVTDLTCLRSKSTFFIKFLNFDSTFCAGSRNGTSVCNSDTGGGMFFPQMSPDGVETWYLRGIVSISAAKNGSCDANNYAVFTDAARYLDWIERNI